MDKYLVYIYYLQSGTYSTRKWTLGCNILKQFPHFAILGKLYHIQYFKGICVIFRLKMKSLPTAVAGAIMNVNNTVTTKHYIRIALYLIISKIAVFSWRLMNKWGGGG